MPGTENTESAPVASKRIIVIDDDERIALGLQALLELDDWIVEIAHNPQDAYRSIASFQPAVALIDLDLGKGGSGLAVLEQIKAHDESVAVVMMSGVGTVSEAVRAMELGAETFIVKPIGGEQLGVVLEQARRMSDTRSELNLLREKTHTHGFTGVSAWARQLDQMIGNIAPANAPVLIEGETGTGKGVVARMLHDRSRRSALPFIDLNCAGLSTELLQSELFGHERGAFTGATSAKPGLLEVAAGGTLFLDEIGEMDLTVQARLLKAVEEKRFRRVGGVRELEASFRLIAATNCDLEKEVEAQRFRRDLYFRLNVLRIKVLPLRERREDIPLLAELLLARLGRELGSKVATLSDAAMEQLKRHSWPGNVRELRNALERGLILSNGGIIQARHLALEVPRAAAAVEQREIGPLDDMIRDYMQFVVDACDGNVRDAARRLKVSPTTIYARLQPKEPDPTDEQRRAQ